MVYGYTQANTDVGVVVILTFIENYHIFLKG